MTPLADLSQDSVIRLFYYITLMSLEKYLLSDQLNRGFKKHM